MRSSRRLLALLLLALGAGTALRADPSADFLDLVVRQARAGDHDALRFETFGRKFAPELTDVQCGELCMLFGGYEVTRRTLTPFARWKSADVLSFNGRPTAYVDTPDAVAQFDIRSVAVNTQTGQPSVGTIVLPIIFRQGHYWIVAVRYRDAVAPGRAAASP